MGYGAYRRNTWRTQLVTISLAERGTVTCMFAVQLVGSVCTLTIIRKSVLTDYTWQRHDALQAGVDVHPCTSCVRTNHNTLAASAAIPGWNPAPGRGKCGRGWEVETLLVHVYDAGRHHEYVGG